MNRNTKVVMLVIGWIILIIGWILFFAGLRGTIYPTIFFASSLVIFIMNLIVPTEE